MSTASPRVGLTVMADSDFVNPFVVTSNSTKMDTITAIAQCTSSTRPATPFDGQWIYETDMQNLRRWSKADGKWYLRGGSGVANAAGLVGQFSDGNAHQLAGVAGGGLTTISLHDYNLTLQNGHTYKINEHGWFNLAGTWNGFSTNSVIPEFFTIAGVGSNPALSDSGSLHYFYQPYEQAFNPGRKPYYKTFTYTVPGAVGIGNTSNVFFRSLMRVDTSTYPTNVSLGRPSTTLLAKAYVYDLGALGAN